MDDLNVFCSVVIPTVGRSSVARAIDSVVAQDFTGARVEVIVVNDSGGPLAPAPWQETAAVRVVTTQRCRQAAARNEGAAVAAGRYLLFLDDDDWLVPGALTYFWHNASQHPEAGCIYGSFELVDEQGRTISHHRLRTGGNTAVEVVSGHWLQVASVLIRTDIFRAAGGFSPEFPISEELDLFSRLSLCTPFVGQDVVVAQIFRGHGWQTSVDYTGVYEYNRCVRDRALSMPDAFSRLWTSAAGDPYWHGRIARMYAVSMLWNFRRKHRFRRGVQRGTHALRTMLGAPSSLFTMEFWRAVRHDEPLT
jgi:glycosyltransferase involved in cell wall biosynthesis